MPGFVSSIAPLSVSLPLPQAAKDKTFARQRALARAAILLAWFGYFSWNAIFLRFAPDDLMNIVSTWRFPPLRFLAAQFLPWRGFYRPAGGLFYLPLLGAFGLNPMPYHVLQLLLLLANVWLVWRFASLLRCPPLAAWLTALLACYHAGIANITYNTAFIYDVLCGFFYLAAMVWYIGIRESGRSLRPRDITIFLALHLCALNSKEMAVTLPVMVLCYELLYQTRRPLIPILLAGILNLLHIYGVAWRPGALAGQFAYHPVFSYARISDFWTHAFGDLFEKWDYFDMPTVLAAGAALGYYAFRRRRPDLRFAWLLLALGPLPIEFLPNRGGACLYIPFFGWAILMASLAIDLARAAAEFLSGDPILGRLGRPTLFALLLAAAAAYHAVRTHNLKENLRGPMTEMGVRIEDTIGQMRALHPQVRPHETILFLNDPFTDWDMAFIAELWFRDRTLNIKLHRKIPATAGEIASAEHVFDFREGRLIQIR